MPQTRSTRLPLLAATLASRSSMAESQEDSVVYLEDIETQLNTQSTQSQGDASTSSAASQTASSSLAVGGKRQRSLMDMFSGS